MNEFNFIKSSIAKLMLWLGSCASVSCGVANAAGTYSSPQDQLLSSCGVVIGIIVGIIGAVCAILNRLELREEHKAKMGHLRKVIAKPKSKSKSRN
jgi:hypothetical protein